MVNRDKILDRLLKNLDPDDVNDSDIDLIFRYLEKYISNPNISKPSKKFHKFEINRDIGSLQKIYTVRWKSDELDINKI